MKTTCLQKAPIHGGPLGGHYIQVSLYVYSNIQVSLYVYSNSGNDKEHD